MGIIAWIVLGPGAGLLANMLIPGRNRQRSPPGRTGERAGRRYECKRSNQDAISAYDGSV